MYFSVPEVREKATDGANTNTTQNHILINSPYTAIVLKAKCREPKKYIVLGDREQATDGANTTTQNHIQINSPYTTEDKVRRT